MVNYKRANLVSLAAESHNFSSHEYLSSQIFALSGLYGLDPMDNIVTREMQIGRHDRDVLNPHFLNTLATIWSYSNMLRKTQ